MNKNITHIALSLVTLIGLGFSAAGCGSGPEGEGAYYTYDDSYCETVVTPDASGENEAGQRCDDDEDCANGLHCDLLDTCTCQEG
jgi:hypothetical protein